MSLKEYRRKRDFKKTPEPGPGSAGRDGRLFVVQKHAATSLHYDLRLQIGDALKSWAVPKGPSLDPKEKRLAVEVEDHPVDYASFEGVIPEGQYGAGTVMIWDSGTWSPVESDPVRALDEGELKFNLNGERLKGRWVLVRTKRAARQPGWLLIKERDSGASPGVHAETFATSVTTGRSMGEIAAGAPVHKQPARPAAAISAHQLKGARKAPMPVKFRPQLAVSAEAPPEGDEWIHEVKFDGYRLLVMRTDESVQILSRSGLDWTNKLQHLAAAARERVRVKAVLDGEAVILNSRGVSDFQALQNAIHSRRSQSIVFLAFDLPWCDGYDLTQSRLEDRKALLAELIGARQEGQLRLSEHVVGNGRAAFERVCTAGLEGIVSKRRSDPYSQARDPSWIKVKCFNQQEFVVGGFTPAEGSREQFGALLLGYFEGKTLRFAGRVGTGFSAETLRQFGGKLRSRVQAKPPFVNPPAGHEARGVSWVRPELVVQVQFRDWTGEGVIRHASFRGERDDLDPRMVARQSETLRGRPEQRLARHESAVPPPKRLTNPDRIVFPDRGSGYVLTKRQVAEYYEAVAERMLPHVANRPLSILRCPDGEGGKTFFQKHPAKGMPPAVRAVEIREDQGASESHLRIHDAEGLLGLVQMNALEFHPWSASAQAVEHPDRLVFDLDPGAGVSWMQTINGALMVRDALAQAKLHGFARVSGGKGIHIVVALRPGHTWAEAKDFSRAAAEALVRVAPRRFVAVAGASNREGRIFIDYLRNTRGATAIAPYSTRARPGAPVALPVAWDELEGLGSAAAFSVPAVLRRLAVDATDPWKDLLSKAGTLPNRR